MKYYAAPLEGVTGTIHREVHHACFPGMDQYYMPFCSPTMHHSFTNREKRELMPVRSQGIPAVPQILSKVAADFLWAAKALGDMGYREVNLNLGCPSGTVTAKGKGAGFLRDPDGLDAFLEQIYRECPIPVSIKTRLGWENPQEFRQLLQIFNRYPVKELILHPRVRLDYYKKPVRLDAFRLAMQESKLPMCYNGNVNTVEACKKLEQEFPNLNAIMLGRGLLADPALAARAQGGKPAHRQQLKAYHALLVERYLDYFGNDRTTLCRMKEYWPYWVTMFEGSEKVMKRIRKSTALDEYRSAVSEVFSLPLREAPKVFW